MARRCRRRAAELAAAVLGGSIVVLGGESPTQTFAQVEAYDPARDTWSTLPPLPTARHGLAAAAVDGRIYAIAGGPRPGGTRSDANEAYGP